MEKTLVKSDLSILRNDFEVYKTQVIIYGSLGLVVIFILICFLIYAFILIRKHRIHFEEKLEACERKARFTLDRPKLLKPSSSYEPPFIHSNKPQFDISVPTSFDYKGVDGSKNIQVQPNSNLHPPKSHNSNGNVSVPSSFNNRRLNRPKNLQIPSTDIELPKSPSPNGNIYTPNISTPSSFEYKPTHKLGYQQSQPFDDSQFPKSPSPSVNRLGNYRRVNESFLNKNRTLYSPKEEGVTPQIPSPPALQVEVLH